MLKRKWVLFDVGGVLEIVDDDAWQDEWWLRWRRVSGLVQSEFDARVASATLPRIDLSTGTEATFWRELSGALGLDATQCAAMRADFWNAYCGRGNEELIEYARRLGARVGVAILSNSADGAREEEERRYAFSAVFDPICYSHEQGVSKSDAAAYLLALERMGAAPSDVLFVDDHQASVDGAEAVGIRAVLHRDNAATIAAIEDFLRP